MAGEGKSPKEYAKAACGVGKNMDGTSIHLVGRRHLVLPGWTADVDENRRAIGYGHIL